jgi:hypothetical protein
VANGDPRRLVTLVAAAILLLVGEPWYAVVLAAVAAVGLIAFLRATHPRGAQKPNLNIFFDDIEPWDDGDERPDEAPEGAEVTGFAAAAPAVAQRPPAPDATVRPVDEVTIAAEVIELRHTVRRAAPAPTLDDAVAASTEASQSVGTANGNGTPSAPEVADELSAHHVRLLRQVQTHLRDYE